MQQFPLKNDHIRRQDRDKEKFFHSENYHPSPPLSKGKITTSTSTRPQKHRQSLRSRKSRGMLGNLQDNSNQPLEILDSEDEQPPQLEGGENVEE